MRCSEAAEKLKDRSVAVKCLSHTKNVSPYTAVVMSIRMINQEDVLGDKKRGLLCGCTKSILNHRVM